MHAQRPRATRIAIAAAAVAVVGLIGGAAVTGPCSHGDKSVGAGQSPSEFDDLMDALHCRRQRPPPPMPGRGPQLNPDRRSA